MCRSDTMEIFRGRLRALRECQGKSCLIISELCGLSPDAVRRYESGEAVPRMPALIALADYFGVTSDYLIGRTETPQGYPEEWRVIDV